MATTKATPRPRSGTQPKHPAPTTVLLVRHGQTPTTGKLLPGRAAGLHLADEGRAQAEIAAERIGALKRVDASTARRSNGQETAAPIAKGAACARRSTAVCSSATSANGPEWN